MKKQEVEMNYLQIKALTDKWCEDAGIDSFDTWHHPYKAEGQSAMTVVSVLWSLHTERRMSEAGMRFYFDRYLRTRLIAC